MRGIGGFLEVEVLYEGFEIFAGIDAIEFAGLDEREEDGGRLGSPLGVRAVPGFSADDGVS